MWLSLNTKAFFQSKLNKASSFMQSGLQANKLTLNVKKKKILLFLINVNWFITFITGYKK